VGRSIILHLLYSRKKDEEIMKGLEYVDNNLKKVTTGVV